MHNNMYIVAQMSTKDNAEEYKSQKSIFYIEIFNMDILNEENRFVAFIVIILY